MNPDASFAASRTRPAWAAGAVYFLAVFAVGFVVGAFRTTLVEPAIGAIGAVAAEAPLMLAASWMICRAVVRRAALSSRPATRLAMGGTALALLLIAETLLGILAFGRGPALQLAAMTSGPGAIGFAAQVAFGLMPLLQAACDARRARRESMLQSGRRAPSP
jgi:hypothetical protein